MKIYKSISRYIVKYKLLISTFIIINFATWIISLVIPYITGEYMDNLIKIKDKQTIYQFIKIFILIQIVQLFLIYFQNIINVKLKTNISFDFNHNILKHIQKLPLSYFNNTDTIYMNQQINSDSYNIVSFILDNYVNAVIKGMTIIYISLFIFKVNRKIAFGLLAFIPLYIILYLIFKKKLYKTGYQFKESQNRFFSRLNEQLYNIRLIKINSWFETLEDDLKNSFMELFKVIMKYTKISTLFSNTDLAISSLSNLILLFYGGLEILNGRLSIGEFLIINSYFSMLLSCTSYFLNLGKSYQDCLISYNRIKDITDIQKEHNGDELIDEINEIECRNLSFTFDENKKIIKNFNYKFIKGNIYCIIGENGIGKSTLIDLIIGLQEDYNGQIYYNEIDINRLNMYNIRRSSISFTDQEPVLLNNSIENNIKYGMTRDIKDEDIYSWSKKLNNYEFINSLPNKLKSNIFEQASNISGGEKQKLSLLRAFIKESKVVILDEPTSALDNNSILSLKNILKDIKTDKIIIFVTHNKDIVEICDKVISL